MMYNTDTPVRTRNFCAPCIDDDVFPPGVASGVLTETRLDDVLPAGVDAMSR
jgi:hypothetical protein